MTRTELDAIWKRYSHRVDIDPDLNEVYRAAGQLIDGAYMGTVNLADVLDRFPSCYVHAGLIKIHELAQDDAGGAREVDMFRNAMSDLHMRLSIEACDTSPPLSMERASAC